MSIQLAPVFSDGMTLQREKRVRIWGISDKAEKIDIFINHNFIMQAEVGQGEFEFYLPPQSVMENAQLTIGSICLYDVDFGEIWIAGGQSNMEFLLRYDKNAEETISKAEDEHLRYYCVGKYTFEGQEEDGLDNDTYWNKWFSFQKEVAEQFSAVGVYFALELRKKYKIPIAIIGCNFGGTTASAWMDESYLTGKSEVYLKDYEEQTCELDMEEYLTFHQNMRQNPTQGNDEMIDAILFGGHYLEQYIKKSTEMTLKLSEEEQKKNMHNMELMNRMGPRHPNRPAGLYHVMLKRIASFTVRGVIWYQGENDDVHADVYCDLFKKMICCWRSVWKEELPFLFVQLAPFDHWSFWPTVGGQAFPKIREQQQIVADTVKNVWMISSSDAGNENDIHPKDKRRIGYRLALTAMNRIYHDDVAYEYPRCKKIEIENGNLVLTFSGAKELCVNGEQIQNLSILADNQNVDINSFSTVGNKLIIETDSDCSGKSVSVQFACTPYYKVNLYNEAGIPAVPFSLSLS